jgi:hypothetical protein
VQIQTENDGMHWFWRATIAVVVSFLIWTAINVVFARMLSGSAVRNVPLQIGLSLVRCATPLVIFGLLTRWCTPVRIPPGHCQKCGYNLTGNVSGVCPECGEKI